MGLRVLVLHGPNLTLETGDTSLSVVDAALQRAATAAGHELKVFQANAEVTLLEHVLAQRAWFDAVIVNPAALAPVAFSLADALMRLGKRAFEVQLEPLPKSWPVSALAEAVEASFIGEGVDSYLAALEALDGARAKPLASASEKKKKSLGKVDDAAATGSAPAAEKSKKTLGRANEHAVSDDAAAGSSRPRKTLGRDDGPAAVKSPMGGSMITRATVKAKASQRLSGALAPEALAAWARSQWQALVSGADVEPGAKDLLEDVLLTLSSSAKASDHVVLTAIAKLDT